MRRSTASSRVLGFAIAAFALAACQTVAGIEDRTLDPDALSPKPTPECEAYCTLVMDACKGDNAVYNSKALCLGICAKLEPGDAEDTKGVNTVSCRVKQAEEAVLEPEGYCKNAGPGGNGVCGTDCDAYCTLFPTICPEQYAYASTADCLKFCNALPDQDSFNTEHDHGGDTIECRLVHLSSATDLPDDHCPHAPIPPSKPWCIAPDDEAPTCVDYCKIEMVACEGTLSQYESDEECVAVCEALDPGLNGDESGNTVACRRYHAFSASVLPNTHCYHSGPTGDGHCGDHGRVEDGHTGNCESYCTLVAAACPDDFDEEFGDAETCMSDCIELPEAEPDSKYTVASAQEGTDLNCRVLYAVRAFADQSACVSALGQDQCE